VVPVKTPKKMAKQTKPITKAKPVKPAPRAPSPVRPPKIEKKAKQTKKIKQPEEEPKVSEYEITFSESASMLKIVDGNVKNKDKVVNVISTDMPDATFFGMLHTMDFIYSEDTEDPNIDVHNYFQILEIIDDKVTELNVNDLLEDSPYAILSESEFKKDKKAGGYVKFIELIKNDEGENEEGRTIIFATEDLDDSLDFRQGVDTLANFTILDKKVGKKMTKFIVPFVDFAIDIFDEKKKLVKLED
jgi:hypothetical protein